MLNMLTRGWEWGLGVGQQHVIDTWHIAYVLCLFGTTLVLVIFSALLLHSPPPLPD